jgi:hypothetical protein
MCAALRVVGTVPEVQSFLFFLFLLSVQSYQPGLELVPVAVYPTGEVDEEASASLLIRIREAETLESAQPTDDEVERAWLGATAWITDQIENRRRELERSSDMLIDRRIASLRETHERVIAHRRERLRQEQLLGRDRIARMHEGFIRKRELELAGRIRELESRRGVSIGREDVACGVLEVVPG